MSGGTRMTRTLEFTVVKQKIHFGQIVQEVSLSKLLSSAVAVHCNKDTVLNLAPEFKTLGVLLESCEGTNDHPNFVPTKLFDAFYMPYSLPAFVPLMDIVPGYNMSLVWDMLEHMFVAQLF